MEFNSNSVKQIEVKLLLPQNFIPLIEQITSPKSPSNLPCHFNLNGNWRIYFECLKCNFKVETGMNLPTDNNEPNWIRFYPTNSKFYSIQFLEEIKSMFPYTQIVQIREKICLVDEKYDKLLSSGIDLASARCSYCNSSYFIHYSFYQGGDGDRTKYTYPEVTIRSIVLKG